MPRRKLWVDSNQQSSKTLSSTNVPLIAVDLLADLETDDYAGITITRIIGHVSLLAAGETVSVAGVNGTVAAGIALLPRSLTANASPGDAEIPNPSRQTTSQYETHWYWLQQTPRIVTPGAPLQANNTEGPYQPTGGNFLTIDIRSQRKITAGQTLTLVLSQQGFTTVHEPLAFVWARTLCLLP